jgi:hypothetical protein
MSDRKDCIHPNPPNSQTRNHQPTDPPTPDSLGPPAAIREALLWRFENPLLPMLLRRFGEALFDTVDELGKFGPDPDRNGLTRPALQAAARDLSHTARDLAEIALTADASTLAPTDCDLARVARTWSARATTLAAEIHQATGLG